MNTEGLESHSQLIKIINYSIDYYVKYLIMSLIEINN
jgi:hypothetical protein